MYLQIWQKMTVRLQKLFVSTRTARTVNVKMELSFRQEENTESVLRMSI